MKNLILKLLCVVGVSFIFLFGYLRSFAAGKADSFYLKVASKKQQSLIIGSSRVSVALEPRILEEKLKQPFFNFGFALNASDFGEVYLNAIKKKIDKKTKNGIFIIEVNPLNLSRMINLDEVEMDQDSFLNGLFLVNYNPNFDYIFRKYSFPLYYVLLKHLRPLHNEKKRTKWKKNSRY